MAESVGAKVLVAGGAGYIGSHTVKELSRRGHDVLCFDNLSEGHREAVGDSGFFLGDLAEPESIRKAFESFRPEVVLHFAAHCYVGESVEDPAKYFRNNVANTLNLLETCRDHEVGGFILSSTAATYGNPVQLPITEDHVQAPINPYGETKLICEWMLSDFERAYGLKSVKLRYFNAAGADPEGELGEDHDPETHLIPLVLQTALGRRSSVSVFGTDYDTRDGSCIRDYIHVTDLADAHIRAMEHLLAGGESHAFNLGNSTGTSVLEIIECAERVTSATIAREHCPRRPGDPATLVADSTRITETLGWKPKYADIETILETAWRWMSAHPHGYGK